MQQEITMMGFGMGGLWMLLVIVLAVLGVLALVKYLSK
jgi:Tfp pilus assembly protein PilE